MQNKNNLMTLVNTVQFRFPLSAPRPTWVEIAGFVKQLATDVNRMETVYKTTEDRSLFVKFTSSEAMQDALRKNREPQKFRYSSGRAVEVRMIVAGSNIRYVRVFDLPPEIPDEDVSLLLGQYGTVECSVREKFPVDLGLDHLYTGVRGVFIDVKHEIPSSLEIANHRGRIFYEDLKNKCFECRKEGHRKDACPLRSERNQEKPKRSSNTYAGVLSGIQENEECAEEEVIEEETIEVLDEEMQQSTETEEEQDPTKIVFKNKTDQLWYERKGILNYTEKKEKMMREYAEEQRKKKEEDLLEQEKYAARKKARRNAI